MTELVKVKAIVEYDGTAYKGFQTQAKGPTIQGEMERALRAVTQEEIRLVGAGRTDAGVHAKGQVVHFQTAWRHSFPALQRAWNAKLARDISVRDLHEVPTDFHARFSAVSREYSYSIYTSQVRQPLRDRYAYHVAEPLAVAAMAEAARYLCGRKDFSAFGRPPWGENAVRTVYRAVWQAEGETLCFDIRADAFLRRMVRLIVGTLLLVGWGRLGVDDLRDILLSRDANHPVAAVPARGLCLRRVHYPPSAEYR